MKNIRRCKVVILIDEYDTPIQQGHSRNFYNEVITFMRNFISGGLKDNPSLAFGVLTGILRVSKENLFNGPVFSTDCSGTKTEIPLYNMKMKKPRYGRNMILLI